jgi:hypothetical protein
MRCPQCKEKLVTGAKFCHQCGTALPPEVTEKTVSWYYDPVFVILIIFLVLAVFGLPLLWRSPRFTEWQKWTISILTVIYTGLILGLTFYLVFFILLPYIRQITTLT